MLKKRYLAAIGLGLVAVAAAAFLGKRPPAKPSLVAGELPALCRDKSFEGVAYVVCEIDPRTHRITVARTDADGKPYGSLEAFGKAMAATGKPVLLAMNAGMYHEGLGPVGLFVDNAQEEAPLNTADAKGNFFLKPNGVFFVGKDGRAGVLETSAYATAKLDVAFATQSGPMLVIDGQLHPRFEADGLSRYTRNGVGVRGDGMVVLAISRGPVSLGSFGRLFKDTLACPNALFLDGDISALSDGRRMIVGGKRPVGPILAISEKE
ncbi:hypothetical protein ASD44_02840 [Mesorhizobium sp. Root554]|uniref:phosphodiester glycosidase family protein n=1 Tax=unclassified Mesorhizobium TaxID=325217 RepID=UPI0006FEE74A|nr:MULTISPECIES: phosphodiester glycosidase family protein [unclassified Mesorhizobium]KQZ13126.1 hypothetical protein ASD27_02845 [Mesorhizobium sp. Root1471]KQZ35642.1 hypothetical protein ASD44_02840 [Mesorhizobium sp. Root554]